MVRISPLASAGLSRFAASFWPAWPPAPIIVWASSMNKIIGVGEDFTSSMRPLRRFSNSPFMPAPACSSARSSVRTSTFLSGGGTSPCAMRSANPSTTAVLPTPASPVRMGLFWRRRIRISTTWRISKSRPRTGSTLPLRAFSVRLTVNWSRFGVLPPRRTAGPASAPGAAAAAAETSSCEPSTIDRKSLRSSSGWILCSSLLTSWVIRASSSLLVKARMAWPLRIRDAPKSSEPIVHASLIIFSTDGLMEGVRALPLLSLSRLRSSSFCRRDVSTLNWWKIFAASLPLASSSFVKKCSISMS